MAGANVGHAHAARYTVLLAPAAAAAHPSGCSCRWIERIVMRIVVIGMLVLIIVSLGSALVFIYRDESGSKRAVKALAIRVGLSIALFLFIMGAYYFGFVPGRLGS
jgi:hypothetical protein